MNKNLPCLRVLVFVLCSTTISAFAQQRIISGKVTDETQQGLPGTSVQLKGTNAGTVTDTDGNYTITVTSSDQILIFSFLGYIPEEVLVGSQTKIDMMLMPDIATLGEVVVIGYGEQRRSDFIGAASQITSAQIAELPVTTLEQTLSGQVSGVQLRGNGQPGGGPEVLIRGITSIGASNGPLYVVDGFPLGNLNTQNDNNVLSSISPSDIESITVLKDATSKAIYGSRAAGGIIMITTKKGKLSTPSVTFSSSVGVQSIPDYEKPTVLNATELAQFQRERFEDNIRVLQGREPTEADIPIEYRNPEQYGVGTNWFDELTRDALMQEYNVSVQGGSDNVKYSLSMGHFNQDGTVIDTGFKRYSFRSNIDAKITDKIRVGLNIAPMFALRTTGPSDPNSDGFSVYGAITSSFWADPSAPIRNADGTLATSTLGDLITSFTSSPVAKMQLTVNKARTTQILMATYLEVDIAKGLTAKSSLSTQFNDRRIQDFRPSILPQDNTLNPFVNGSGVATAGTRDVADQNIVNENILTYRTTLANNHSLVALAGFTLEKRESETTDIDARNIIDETFIIPNSGNVKKDNVSNFTGSGGFEENALLSVLARVNYSYKDKYFVTGAFRRDGSSRFAQGLQYANFPAIGAAWRISNESFFQNSTISSIVSDLKFEAGYGVTGNNSIGNYQSQGTVANTVRRNNVDVPVNYVFGGNEQLGYTVTAVPNSRLTWEQSKQLDIGLDIGLFTNKLNLTFDYYNSLTEDFLIGTPIPTSTGFGSILSNGGSLQNRGIEIELNTKGLVESSLKYDIGFNFTLNRNKVIDIDNTIFRGSAGNGTNFSITREGDPVGLFQGLKITGLFTQEQIDDPTVPKYSNATVGSLNYEDYDGDGKLEFAEDYQVIGNPHPDFIFGMTHNVNYKNFDLRVVLAGAVGQQIFELRKEITKNYDGIFNLDREVLERYRPGDDPTTKSVPTTVGNTQHWRAPNSASVHDASYLFVRNITLGYNIKGALLNNFIKRGRVYTSIQNPFLFSEYKIGNPEINRSSDTGSNALVRNVNQGSYPISTTYTVGFNVTF
jgi:TonB-dependent starch-binding outer membrane protein SusC